MTTYISLYQDADGANFVGEPWEAETPDEFRACIETELLVLRDIPVVNTIKICEVKDTLERPADE